jgi:cytochrome b involved in lipid metabolism/uncharacterized membrane protein
MISEVSGLPIHPLIVHSVVVLVPLSLIGLVLIVVRPSWRRSLGWWVVLLSGGAAAGAWLAKESGEALAAVIGRPIHHASLGAGLPYFVSAMFASITLFVGSAAIWDWHTRRSAAKAVAAGGTVPTAAPADVSDPGGIEALLGQTSSLLGTTPASGAAAPAESSRPVASNGGTKQTSTGPHRMPLGLKIVSGLALVVAIVTMIQTVRVGDSGTREVWGSVLENAESASVRTGQNATESAAPSTTGTPNAVPTTAYTMAEVAERNDAADCWTVIDDRVFDLTDWIARHPGGASPIESLCGRDGTSTFNAQHQGQPRPTTQLDAFVIGVLQ